MKRILAVVCLALALSGTADARSLHIRPSVPSRIAHFFGGLISGLTHWRIFPSDGGVTLPPPH